MLRCDARMLEWLVVLSAAIAPHLQYAKSPHPLPLKQAIARLAAESCGGAKASVAQAFEAEQLIQMLEASSPPARSWAARGPLLDGAWDQVYTSNPGAGTVAADGVQARRKLIGRITGHVLQLIDYEEPFGREVPPAFSYAQRARAGWLSLGLQAELRASVDPQPDAVTWHVSFDTMRWSLLGGKLPLRTRSLPPGSGGVWRTTYLDHDTRVLRAQSHRGGPPTTYVLSKAAGPSKTRITR